MRNRVKAALYVGFRYLYLEGRLTGVQIQVRFAHLLLFLLPKSFGLIVF